MNGLAGLGANVGACRVDSLKKPARRGVRRPGADELKVRLGEEGLDYVL